MPNLNMDQLVSALRKLSEDYLRECLNLVHMDGLRSLARHLNIPTRTLAYRDRVTREWHRSSSISKRGLVDPIIKTLQRGAKIHKDLLSLAEVLSDDGFL